MNEEALDAIADAVLERVLAKLASRDVAVVPSSDAAEVTAWDDMADEFGGEPVAPPSSPLAPVELPGYEHPLPPIALDGSPVYTGAATPVHQSAMQRELQANWSMMRAAGLDPAKSPTWDPYVSVPDA